MTESLAVLPARTQRQNTIRLTLAQALAGSNSIVIFATGAVIGAELAPGPAFTTLPITIFVVGMAACILPTGVIARRYGRKAAFLAGTGCGALSGLLSALAITTTSFWLFCLATFFGGVYAAVVASFRFAAADGVEPQRRARALATVMGGGVVAGVLGPELVTHTMHLWPEHMFVATYLVQVVVAMLSAIILGGVNLPRPSRAEIAKGRPLSEIAAQPAFVSAAFCGAVSYMLMNFVMTAAPLAMRLCGHPQETANTGIEWHVIAMYGPSFFTGRLIMRFGTERMIAAGLILLGAATAVGLAGVTVWHFWITLVLLGLGWNFGFLGSSALVLKCHRPEEATRVQPLNDVIVFGTMAVGSFSSGALLATAGWNMVLWVSLAPLALAIAALVCALTLTVRAQPAE